MNNITTENILEYLTSIGSIKPTDNEKTQITKTSQFMASVMLYNYYNRRSGISVDLTNINVYFDKVNNFAINN